MQIKINWKKFFIIFFSIIGLGLLFIPFPKTKIVSEGIFTVRTGNYDSIIVDFPWRSFNQEIIINLNITEGNLTLQILDSKAYWEWLLEEPYDPYFQRTNITELNTKILLDPPLQGPVAIVVFVEEGLTYSKDIKANYYFYYNNYGIFFLSIAIILISYYIYQRYKRKL